MHTDKKVAIVTGAGSGIGRATAVKLAAAGYAVAVAGRTESTLKSVAQEIGVHTLVCVADCSKSAEVNALTARVLKEWGHVDVLVNNVGVAPMHPIAQVSDAEWEEILATNLSSAFFGTRAVWPAMEKTGGVIVNVSSMAAKDPFAGLGAYACAKIGVNMLTLATAREGAAVGIRVHCVAPGATDTPMLAKVLGGAKMDAASMMRPSEIADVIVGMVRGENYVSGETVYVHR